MKIRRFTLLPLAFTLFLFGISQGSSQSLDRDTLSFRQLFHGGLAQYVSFKTLSNAYFYIQKRYPLWSGSSSPSAGVPIREGYYDNYTYSTRPDWPSFFVRLDDAEAGIDWYGAKYYKPTKEDLLYPLQGLHDSAIAYQKSFTNKKTEKLRLVQTLAAFDTVATHKPVFYADIYSRFKGNYAKYVDNLFSQSILCNKRRMEKFVRYPKAEDLQKDPGVQFVIGLALYELWIKDVREGKVKDKPSH